jgi:hypothetical protein
MRNEWFDATAANVVSEALAGTQALGRPMGDAIKAIRAALPDLVLRSDYNHMQQAAAESACKLHTSIQMLNDVEADRDRLAARVEELEQDRGDIINAFVPIRDDLALTSVPSRAGPSERERREHWSRALAGFMAQEYESAGSAAMQADLALSVYDKRFPSAGEAGK